MSVFPEVDDLRREFGARWKFSPFMRQTRGKYVIDFVVAREIRGKRQLRFSSCSELAQRIREIERVPSSPADRAASPPGEVGRP